MSNQNKNETEMKEKNSLKKYYNQPVHHHQDSLFSSSSGYTNYRGLVNLCYIILVLSNFRVALENLLKYGLLVDPLRWMIYYFSLPNIRPMFSLMIILNMFILISFQMERLFISIRGHVNHIRVIVSIHLLVLLSIPLLVFNFYDESNPVAASTCCLVYSIVFLKLVSYHMVNHWFREGIIEETQNEDLQNNNQIHKENSKISYPNNLTLYDLYYFMIAPTLCYELNFPRTKRIRKTFVMKRILEIIFLLQLEIGLIQQWMVPAVENSLEPFMEMSYVKMLERLLKLAVPNHLVWLIMFYYFFHSWLNLVGELVQFGDREFYKDWWNSDSIEYFWKTWNIPVHRWCLRHVYLPLVSYNINHKTSVMIVFLLSAFFHEYLVSVPLNMYRIWAFTGMVLQIPFAYIVKQLKKSMANYAVWLLLIIGQPLCILMYYHDFYVIHFATKHK